MATDTIRRQHETTSFPELRGVSCSAFTAVKNAADCSVGPLYIRLDDVWHRFYLDAGLLFWQQGPWPDPENDLLEGEEYSDLGVALQLQDTNVLEISMHDCQLRLEFDNGARIVLYNGVQDDSTTVVELVPGTVLAH